MSLKYEFASEQGQTLARHLIEMGVLVGPLDHIVIYCNIYIYI